MENKTIGILFRDLKQDYTKRIIEKLKLKGYAHFNPPHLYVLGIIIREDGIRLTDIAEKLSISKQSIKEIIDFLEDKKYLIRVPDPEDLRAKKVNLTKLGKKLHNDAKKASEEIRAEYSAIIGEEALLQLETTIKRILEVKTTI